MSAGGYANDYYEPRRWGLKEARAMSLPPPFPVTLYNVMDDDTSGVAGVWMPNGEVLQATSKVGMTITYTDHDFRIKSAIVCWDGAAPDPVSATPIGHWDEEKKQPIYQGHSRGLLLGDYQRLHASHRDLREPGRIHGWTIADDTARDGGMPRG